MTYEEAIEILQEERDYAQFPQYVKEAIKIATSALKKQIPKKPINVEKYYYECFCCEHDLGISGDDTFVYKNYRPMYCSNCGQALDWSDNGIF